MTFQATHADKYHRKDIRFSLRREKGGYRVPDSVLDAAINESYTIDTPEEGEFANLRPVLKRERRHALKCSSNRNANVISELGFDPVEVTQNFYLQTARFLHAVMGDCVTTGTTTGITGTISTGQGTAILTITGVTLTVDAHIGHYLQVTSGSRSGFKYHIIDNTTTTITVDIATATGINGETFELFGGPFVHDITQGIDQPSYTGHLDMPHPLVPAERIIQDLLGIIINTWELTSEVDGDAIQAVGMIIAKQIEGNAITNPACLSDDLFMKWGHAITVEVEYDGNLVIDNNIVDSVRISIENNDESKKIMGDFHGAFKKIGTVDYNLVLHYFPSTRILYDLRNTYLVNYAGDLDANIYFIQDANRFIKFMFTKLYLEEHPVSPPSADDAIIGVDAGFRLQGDGALAIQAKDDLGLIYFEGSTVPSS